jgi:glycosyltransferase involved in cell wall biosynthesis
MRILCVIDHFGSGGAQRQMVNLACGLKAKSHHVEMFIYHPGQSFFRSAIDLAGIPVHEMKKGQGFSLKVLWNLMRLLRRGRYDAVISFLDAPNIYVELASIAARPTKVIVSERSSGLAEKKRFVGFMRRVLHSLADAVVANSYSHAAWLTRYPWLTRKVKAIYNGYSLEPEPEAVAEDVQIPELNLLVIGRVGPEKNGIRLVEALDIFHRRHGYVPKISWAGKEDQSTSGAIYCRSIYTLLDQHAAVKANWTWLGERRDIPALLKDHRALMHPSLYEGLPNVVCEALIAGRPVLASNVCDHATLVKHRQRGFLFDPLDPKSIADSIECLDELCDAQWRAFSANARSFAVKSLNIDRMVREYETLLMDSTGY